MGVNFDQKLQTLNILIPKETSLFSILHHQSAISGSGSRCSIVSVILTSRLKRDLALGVIRALQQIHERQKLATVIPRKDLDSSSYAH
jgi:hypothetical protein